LFVFFFIMAVSGIALGWKKNAGEVIMPSTKKGTATEGTAWLPIDSLSFLATGALFEEKGVLSEIDRIDVRPSKNVMKFLFEDQQLEVQLDPNSGTVLSVGRRHSDWIEQVHDGSIVDDAIGLPSGLFKVFYNSVMGCALVVFTLTGFWLWYGPKQMRRG
jgi:uncharacterized iron-regulated membrane protein